ncbi:hypothetical protein ACHWQZ_G005199 [Mnemiopsis leidyi]
MKLSLDRDFTRFLNDPTFPYKVTVCIGEEQRYCSGALLAQQSSVLERKFRQDDGVLMFEEFLDVAGSCSSIFKCIEYLHGADLEFDIETLAVVLKFASLYEVEDLFEQAVIWLKEYLDTTKCARTAIFSLKIAKDLSDNHYSRIEEEVRQFIQSNSILFENNCDDILEIGITGHVLLFLMDEIPDSIGNLLQKWIALSDNNKEFILNNRLKISFLAIYPKSEQFTSFVDTILEGGLSNDSLRALVDLQRSFFIAQAACGSGQDAASAAPQHRSSADLHHDANNSPQVREPVSVVTPTTYDPQLLRGKLYNLNDYQLLVGNLPPNAKEDMIRRIFLVYVMPMKLSLDRDFTRFLNDPTFPYKVTVCIGEEQRYCSGALLAQQSSVLERKFREDDGVLMFEEFLDVAGSYSSIFKCIEYLHGADLKFDIETLAVVLKFASLYEVEDLFEQAVIWLEEYLDTSKSVRSAIGIIKIANTLNHEESILQGHMKDTGTDEGVGEASLKMYEKKVVRREIGVEAGDTEEDVVLVEGGELTEIYVDVPEGEKLEETDSLQKKALFLEEGVIGGEELVEGGELIGRGEVEVETGEEMIAERKERRM